MADRNQLSPIVEAYLTGRIDTATATARLAVFGVSLEAALELTGTGFAGSSAAFLCAHPPAEVAPFRDLVYRFFVLYAEQPATAAALLIEHLYTAPNGAPDFADLLTQNGAPD